MTNAMKLAARCAAALVFATPSLAQEMPVPKVFQGMQGQKGQWRMEVLDREGRGGARKGTTISVCTDLVNEGQEKLKPKPGCKHTLVKDAADEAVVESECPQRKSTIRLKREGDGLLMSMERNGPRGPQSMTMRYTHLGPCREGPG